MAARRPEKSGTDHRAAELARRSRKAQGLPPTVEDPETLRRIAAVIGRSV